jgi:hypothetical protein
MEPITLTFSGNAVIINVGRENTVKNGLFYLFIPLLLGGMLAACNSQPAIDQAVSTAVAQTLTASPLHSPLPTQTQPPPTSTPVSGECVEASGPGDFHINQESKEKLSTAELQSYLGMMGIAKLCFPPNLGAPRVNADWDSARIPATGRMFSIGFQNQFPGMRWGGIFLLYSTYDFKFGTEFDVFARAADRDALQSGNMAGSFTVGGAKGFLRIYHSMLCMGKCEVYKTAVFPFEKYYVALVADVGSYDPDADWEKVVAKVMAGEIPAENQPAVQALDAFLQSIQFQPASQ